MKKYILTIIACSMSAPLFACRVIVKNDTKKHPVILSDKAVKELKIVELNKTEFVGSEHRRPMIGIYLKEYPKGPYIKKYEVEMIACAKTKEVDLSVSDIINDAYDKQLFKATPYVINTHKTLMKALEH